MRKHLHCLSVVLLLLIISLNGLAIPYAPLTTTGSNYDIVYHRIEISVDPGASASITSGKVTTYFKTKVANVSSIDFDLEGAMSVSSATYHGSSIAKNHNTSTDVLSLTLPNIAVAGTLDSVTVAYSGTPSFNATSTVPSGFNRKFHGSPKKYVIFTLDEPYTAHTWWPCKESLDDKIDSVDFIVTAPSTYKVAGNGLVTEVVSGSNIITTWKTRYPIATYAINFAVTNYQNYQYTINTGGKDVPVMNYFYAEDNTTSYRQAADELKKIIPMYATLFGVDYPYLNEKYGLAECGTGWGALEVPTMTFVASDAYDKYTLAHEAAHQWFGDMVTTNDWHQIWLNEGFAKYCESVLFPENLYPSELAGKRGTLKSSVSNTLTTYVSNISTPDNIFVGATTEPYEKGAMILSMLRTWIGDVNFFSALKDYLSAPGIKYGFTSVDLLRQYMQPKTPVDLTNFFNDWVYQKGRVTYSVKYQYVNKGVYIQLSQGRTSAGESYFDTPVPIQIQGPGLDTTVVVIDKDGVLYNSVTGKSYGGNTIYYPLSVSPNTPPVLDPQNLVLATSTSVSSATLNNMIVLPVHEVKLDVTSNAGKARIDWRIKADEPLHSVVLERSSDGVKFTPVQSFVPVLSGFNLYEGSATDNILSEAQYYRLKVIKEDGTFLYSKTERVVNKVIGNLVVAPNPTGDYLNIFLPSNFNYIPLHIVIHDLSGKIIKGIHVSRDDKEKITLSTQFLHSGMYWISVTSSNMERLNAQFIKQ